MKSLSRWFLNGLIAFLPISITIYSAFWIASWAEGIFGAPLKRWLGVRDGGGYYFYGLGVFVMIIILVTLGILLEFYLGKLVYRYSDIIVKRIPIVKTIYTTIKELLVFVKPKQGSRQASYMVMVQVSKDIKILGYVTRDTLMNLKGNLAGPDEVAVLLPFSYQMGGTTVIVHRNLITPVDLTFEEGMKLALSAFVVSDDNKDDV